MVNQSTTKPQSLHAWSASNSLLSKFDILSLDPDSAFDFFGQESWPAPTVSCNFSDSRTLKWAKFVPTCKNRQNTAPVWNSGSSIHFFNCEHLELPLECCLALHWFNNRDVAMLASPPGIKFFQNWFRDPLLAAGMTSLQNESYQREALT